MKSEVLSTLTKRTPEIAAHIVKSHYTKDVLKGAGLIVGFGVYVALYESIGNLPGKQDRKKLETDLTKQIFPSA